MPEQHKHVFVYEHDTGHNWDHLVCSVCQFSPDNGWLNAVADLLEALEPHLANVPTDVYDAFEKVCDEDWTIDNIVGDTDK